LSAICRKPKTNGHQRENYLRYGGGNLKLSKIFFNNFSYFILNISIYNCFNSHSMKGPSWPFGINFRQWRNAKSVMLAETSSARSAKLAARLIAGKTLNNGQLIVFTHEKRAVSAPEKKIKVAEENTKAGAFIKTFKEFIDHHIIVC